MVMKLSRELLKTKLIATGVHLLMSIAVFIVLAYLIYYVWYPQPYYSVDGGWQGMRLVAAVDLVLGPLITFLIFNLNKSRREIVFDLVIILTIQFGALGYGVVTTYNQRPVSIVLIDRYIVPATVGLYGDTLDSVSDLEEFSDEKPAIILSSLAGIEGALQGFEIRNQTGIPEHAQIQWYRPAEELKPALEALQAVFREILESKEAADRFEAWLQQNGKSSDEVMIGFFNGRYDNAWLVFDSDARLIGYFL